MNWKKIVIIVVIVLGAAGVGYEIYRDNLPGFLGKIQAKEEVIPENDWKVIISAKDSDQVVEIIYDQKYGSRIIEYGKVLFENSKEKQYKIVAPWIEGGILVERNNINNIAYKIVSKDSLQEDNDGTENF